MSYFMYAYLISSLLDPGATLIHVRLVHTTTLYVSDMASECKFPFYFRKKQHYLQHKNATSTIGTCIQSKLSQKII